MDKTIHDIFGIGSNNVINGEQYALNHAMILGTADTAYAVLDFTAKSGRMCFMCLDVETVELVELPVEQFKLYQKSLELHEKRFGKANIEKTLDYKGDYFATNCEQQVKAAFFIKNTKSISSKILMNDKEFDIVWYSLLGSRQGDSLIVSVSDEVMKNQLSKEALYNNFSLIASLSENNLKYQGNIVRIEKFGAEYLLYIQPYPMEVMQATQLENVSFESIRNPFSVMDFIVNHADSDVGGIIYPNSDKKLIHNYIIVGALNNVIVNIEDFAIGNVRFGINIDTSEKFKALISSKENITTVWTNISTDSLYNAFLSGKRVLETTAAFLGFAAKNDMYTDWFGVVEFDNKVWDMRSHYPRVDIAPIFYIEDCISGESITLTDQNTKIPQTLKIDEEAEYLFEYDWIDKFFNMLQVQNTKLLRLQYAIEWIIQAWNTEDKYNRMIYCSMALEFIVNGEKGKNVFNEYANKAGIQDFVKAEINRMIDSIVERAKLDSVVGLSDELVDELNISINKIIRSKLLDVSFNTKLNDLIGRLEVPISESEKELLIRSRKVRNKLIHGLDMECISTLEAKRLCGITSRLLMYKIMDILSKG